MPAKATATAWRIRGRVLLRLAPLSGERHERRQSRVLNAERFHGGQFRLIGRPAFDCRAQRLGGDGHAGGTVVGSGRSLRQFRAERFDGVFQRCNALVERVKIGVLRSCLSGVLCPVGGRRSSFGLRQSGLRSCCNIVDAARKRRELIAERFGLGFRRCDATDQCTVGARRPLTRSGSSQAERKFRLYCLPRLPRARR